MPLPERLPSSIQTIRIKDPSSNDQARAVVDSLRDILSLRSNKFPNLTEISIEAPFNRDGTKFGAEALEFDASAAGVRLRKLDTMNISNGRIETTDEPWGMPGMRITWFRRCNCVNSLMEL